MTGRLCWLGDKLAERECARCGHPVCRSHTVDSPGGIICVKCNEDELNASLKREIKSWLIFIIGGAIVFSIVYFITQNYP